jgi:hypothetical protein
MAGNLVLNILMSASLNYLWAMVNTQQIILMLPLFNLSLPGNAGIFFNFMMQIASFDIIPTDLFYDDVLGWTPTDPIHQNFADVGFSSTLFIYNIGSMILTISTFPILVLVYLILKFVCGKSQKKNCGTKTRDKLRKCLFWGHPIVTLTEAFTVVCMCTFINLESVS